MAEGCDSELMGCLGSEPTDRPAHSQQLLEVTLSGLQEVSCFQALPGFCGFTHAHGCLECAQSSQTLDTALLSRLSCSGAALTLLLLERTGEENWSLVDFHPSKVLSGGSLVAHVSTYTVLQASTTRQCVY